MTEPVTGEDRMSGRRAMCTRYVLDRGIISACRCRSRHALAHSASLLYLAGHAVRCFGSSLKSSSMLNFVGTILV